MVAAARVEEVSDAMLLARLDEAGREAALVGVDLDLLAFDWNFWARPSQLMPAAGWDLGLFLGGRGAGKTRGGCEWVRKKAREMPGSRGTIVARTAADVRDVLVEGPSGILAISAPGERPLYEPSKRRLSWPNGTVATLFSSEVPDALRGPQSNWTLADEIATWNQEPDETGLTAWDQARIGTRLGREPQLVAMTTPKRVRFLRDLVAEVLVSGRMILKRSRMADNAGNLSRAYLDVMEGLYGGTALAAQELDGEMLDDVEGALWRSEWLDGSRIGALPAVSRVEGEGLYRPGVVIAVDPSVAERPRDECGIVVMVGTGEKEAFRRRVYVVEDLSGLMPPGEWARVVVDAARRWGAPVVAEYNQGGGLVRSALVAVDPGVRVVGVHSRVGKALRAETSVLASQQGRLRMVGVFPDLESQLTTWDPASSKSGARDSPDRLDAMVHGANAFLTEELRGMGVLGGWGGGIRVASSVAGRSRLMARRVVALERGRGMHPELGVGVGWGGVEGGGGAWREGIG